MQVKATEHLIRHARGMKHWRVGLVSMVIGSLLQQRILSPSLTASCEPSPSVLSDKPPGRVCTWLNLGGAAEGGRLRWTGYAESQRLRTLAAQERGGHGSAMPAPTGAWPNLAAGGGTAAPGDTASGRVERHAAGFLPRRCPVSHDPVPQGHQTLCGGGV